MLGFTLAKKVESREIQSERQSKGTSPKYARIMSSLRDNRSGIRALTVISTYYCS